MIKAAAGRRRARHPRGRDRGGAEAAIRPAPRPRPRPPSATAGSISRRFIARARHIEVQVLGDGERAVHCFERECSLQRRRQKIWEEAPVAVLTPAMPRGALRLGGARWPRRSRYRGAGTLEYLYDDESGEFYFIEMNTRIQVEHPVTEMVTGIDLVREMIRIAGGEPLRHEQGDMRLRGHAIEVRINAEDPARNFRPSPGTITALTFPAARHALRYAALRRLSRAAVLRLAARQADRLGREARARAARACGARSDELEDRGRRHHRGVASPPRRRARRSRAASFTRAGSSNGSRRRRRRRARMKEGSSR